MRNINRMNDYFVRYLLGSVGNEDILENIVNCVLRDSGFEEVYNLEIINPHNLPENINLKESVLDVKAITKDNKKNYYRDTAFWKYRFCKENILLYSKKYSERT